MLHIKNEYIEHAMIKEAISKHSRKAYDYILEKVDINEINIELQHIGLDIIVNKDNTSINENCGTATSVFNFMKCLYETEKDNILIFESLKEQEDPDGFQFPTQYEWLHMTGGLDKFCNDVGYLYLEDRVLMCIGFVHAYEENIEWYQLEQVLKEIGELVVHTYTK
ncbi:serine hydrolase [Bacillus sp. FJAT-53711]|uniref:Serine hydrolase n=2 Tax=Bacillus yunxiaonensis TaxID=3127665 RepID=A0ABU8FR64_9BACI